MDGGYEIGDFTFLIDEKTATPVKSGNGRYYIEVKNIPAQSLDVMHSFTISNGTDTYTLNCSTLSYSYMALSANIDENVQNLAKALYLYNAAANVCSGN